MDGMIVAKGDFVLMSSETQTLKAFVLKIQLHLNIFHFYLNIGFVFSIGLTFSFPFGIQREGEVEGEERSAIKLIASYLYSHL